MIKLISKVTRPNTKATFYPMSDTLTPLVKKQNKKVN